MRKKWEIDGVSISEQLVFDKIKAMAQPVGVVLFGADYELKDEVLMCFQRQIPNLA